MAKPKFNLVRPARTLGIYESVTAMPKDFEFKRPVFAFGVKCFIYQSSQKKYHKNV